MSSFAAIRAKAEAAASSAKAKAVDMRDKRQSPSSSSLASRPTPGRAASSTSDVTVSSPLAAERRVPPSSGNAPPPPPRRADSSGAPALPSREPAPPYRATASPPSLPTRNAPAPVAKQPPAPAPRSRAPPQSGETTFVGEDVPAGKESFFSLLDEYFANRGQHRVSTSHRDPIAPPVRATVAHVEPSDDGAPPAPPTWARPSASTASVDGGDFTMSHPPACVRSCSAEDACTDFLPDAHWATPWYESPAPQPPLMQQRSDLAWAGSMMQRGTEKSVLGMALFADLSQCWYRVSYFVGNRITADAIREARYAPRPQPLDRANAEWAYEAYGEIIASFAEEAERSRQPVGDGECWTLAAEAIKSIEGSGLLKPVPSISRTHGSLIYEGKASGKGRQVGRWRGEDVQVRRGDIVEWRKVTINEVNAPRGSYSTLGAPDHTAVITDDAIPTRTPQDGESLLPSELGSFEVIEQSAGQVPTRRRYDLNAFSAGEVWVYRPCAMEQLGLGELAAVWPPPVTAYETS